MKTPLILLLTFCFTIAVRAQEAPVLETHTLKNGLKVYFIKYGKIEAVNISIVINTGKKNEAPGQQGYCNLTANLILKGNKKYTEEDQNDKIFTIGGKMSAYSNFDYTGLEGNFLSKDVDKALDLFSSAVLLPSFEKEKVTQYISYMIDYNTPSKMDVSQNAQVFSALSVYGIDNPLGRSFYKKQLQLITPEKLIEFHQFNYTPKNSRILVCGNFKSDQVLASIQNYFGAWQSAYGEINGVSLDYPSIKKQEIYFVNRNSATQCALRWTKIAPALKDKDYAAFTIANQLFNQTLFKEIREIGGKTYSIGSRHLNSQFSNVMNIACSVRSNEMLNTINLFDKTLQNFSTGTFTQQEFDNEITRFKGNLMAMETPEEVADYYNPILYDFNARKNLIIDVNKLSVEDVQKAIKKYYTPAIYKLVVCGDEATVKPELENMKIAKKYSALDLEGN
jgi:zinc protease